MKIAIADLRPNPYRDLKRLPLDPEKVEALRQSIKDTGFWDNLLARKNDDGDYEAAYGWHRIAACKKAGVDEIDIPVRKLSNTDMARIMAAENMAEWSHDAATEAETVRAVLKAYAAGEIELPKPSGKGKLRYASRSSSTEKGEKPYTVRILADFLRWKEYKVDAALDVIGAADEGTLDDETVADLSTKQAQVIAQQVRRAAKSPGVSKERAKEIGRHLAAGMAKGSGGRYRKGNKNASPITMHNAKEVTDNLIGRAKLDGRMKPKPELPDLETFINRVELRVAAIWQKGTQGEVELEEIIKFRAHDKRGVQKLVKVLRKLADKATDYADRLEAPLSKAEQQAVTLSVGGEA